MMTIASTNIAIMLCSLSSLPFFTQVSGYQPVTPATQYSQPAAPPGGLDHVFLLSNWVLDTIRPGAGLYNDSVILEELQNIHQSLMNSNIGHWEKVSTLGNVLIQIVAHHPGFSGILIFDLFLAITFPAVGLVFCCCHLCGKCRGRAGQGKGEAGKKIFWGSLLSLSLAALFVTTVAALIANLYVYEGIENLPKSLKNISEDVDKYFNHTRESFETILVTNAKTIQNDVINTIANDSENSLIERIKNLEYQVESSQNTTKVLLSSCKDQIPCSGFLEDDGDIETFLAEDIGDITNIRRQLENYLSKNTTEASESTSLIKTLHSMNTEIQDKLGKIQTFLFEVTDKMSSTSSTYQGYVYYVFVAGLVLVSMIFLLLLCYILGIFLIMFGSYPTEDDVCGCNETSGGKFLFSSVYFTFIFSLFLFLLAGGTLTLSYWARLGVCKPLQDPEDSFLFNTLDQYLGRNNITSVDILHRCHQNMTLYNVLMEGQDDLTFFKMDQFGFGNGISEKLFEFESLGNMIGGGISKLEQIKEHIKDISVEDALSELELLKKTVDELQETVEVDKLIRQLEDILKVQITEPIKTQVGSCSPLSASYNTTTASLCTNIMEPVSAIWLAVQGSLMLCLLSLPLAVKLARLSEYKEEYMGVLMNDVEGPPIRINSNRVMNVPPYRASRISVSSF
eukprot:GFUD01016827.1.p1 GENE.GFUD01016827.1~~GFUD01016827.1.p1  ORF type:complete len:679 (-),score=187.21 GFUD01016827.1:122-2158(-)